MGQDSAESGFYSGPKCVKQFVGKTIEKNKFNFFISCDLIGSMLVSAILPLELLIADDIKEIILIDMYYACSFCL